MDKEIVFLRSVAIMRASSHYEPNYLKYLMQRSDLKKSLKFFQVVSAQPGINLGNLSKINLKA